MWHTQQIIRNGADPNQHIISKSVRKQRGYMEREKAQIFYTKLSKVSNLMVHTTDNNGPYDLDVQLGSVCFVDDVDYKTVPDADWSYNLHDPLHRPINTIPGENIVEVDVLDIRWSEHNLLEESPPSSYKLWIYIRNLS